MRTQSGVCHGFVIFWHCWSKKAELTTGLNYKKVFSEWTMFCPYYCIKFSINSLYDSILNVLFSQDKWLYQVSYLSLLSYISILFIATIIHFCSLIFVPNLSVSFTHQFFCMEVFSWPGSWTCLFFIHVFSVDLLLLWAVSKVILKGNYFHYPHINNFLSSHLPFTEVFVDYFTVVLFSLFCYLFITPFLELDRDYAIISSEKWQTSELSDD